ncbi:diaminopropionate ammonia-lyase [Maritimibacter alkaliphilus]|uniref:diaminopropionate ammonia-lyase n=1 Tax=Maritimibacter alkaliphilus TaxID=404236 RepID=UPI001C94D087|nr:diaminopropionate ammonia-lyase [Maritimibacter alkaliphilus]MBY6089281.1 diaminopropionate ammonia-lyase [Maritimibacter alkaliphilus]
MTYLPNRLPAHGQPLDPRDAAILGPEGAARIARVLALRENGGATPLIALPGLAAELGIGALHLKDEGQRLGLGSFKALGGAYALMMLVLEEASQRLGREVAVEELFSDEVKAVAATMTFACATDGNHGRSVAQGAQLMGARSVIFVHGGVSQNRADAIAAYGAEIRWVDGTYDESIVESARVSEAEGWTIVSDTSWDDYEVIPGLVMQGYVALIAESLAALDTPPTHVFLQAGVGGFAAAVAGHLALVLGDGRPCAIVTEPARAACLYESAKQGRVAKVGEDEPTVMAMLECYEPSPLAFRVLERCADGFLTVPEEAATEVMRRLAAPVAGDPAVVAGESGGAGLAGLVTLLRDAEGAKAAGLGPQSRVLVINTEGATDAALYERIVGKTPAEVVAEVAA